MVDADKPILWLHGEVKTPPFSATARIEAGVLLRRLQRGERLSMPASRPMPTIGRRCHELRIVDASQTWRIVYRVDPDAVVIAEVFSKKTATTPTAVIDAARARLRHYDDAGKGGKDDMNKTKRTRLEARGWRVGSANEFLGLSPEEAALVETRLALSQALRTRRVAHGLTQGELARRLKSSQSRVAKMEAGDKTVSVDLLVKALFSLGAKPRDVGRALQRRAGAAV